ncbi:MAG: hypothetical protein ACKVOR_05210 [Flavobacteriales bacterium]
MDTKRDGQQRRLMHYLAHHACPYGGMADLLNEYMRHTHSGWVSDKNL